MVDAGEITTVLRTRLFTHDNTVDETDLVEHLLLTEKINHHFDFSNLSVINSTTIRVFERIDGVTYRQLDIAVYPDDFEDSNTVIVVLDGAGQDMKITLQSSVAEGSAKNIETSVRDTIRI